MRVLIVEDNLDTLHTLELAAKTAGHEVATAETAELGVEKARSFQPHLVVTDFRLPGRLNGLDVLKQIKMHDHRVLVVIMTGFGNELLAVEALRHGAANYLNKPVSLDYFLHMLQKYESGVQRREDRRRVACLVENLRIELTLPNDSALINPAVELILLEVELRYPDMDVSGMHLGLEEMLRNAIEHGNLEIGFDEKRDALEKCNLSQLMERRMSDSKLCNRKVGILMNIESGVFRCTIEDEGPGFDYKKEWDPLSQAGLAALNGRGIFLTRQYFDEVTYSGRGNHVTLIKRLGDTRSG